MPSPFSKTNLLRTYEPDITVNLEDYVRFIGRDRVDALRRLAEPLQGMTWSNINSTFDGGGVAEKLRSVVPIARSLGVDARWYVMEGTEEFFRVTKKFHNLLQGVEQPISMDEIFGTYLDTISTNGTKTHIASDMIVVHDPQPLGLVSKAVLYGNLIWRCHIDTSLPNPVVWQFLLPYINLYDGAIFTMPEFVGQGIHIPVYESSPCIDPMAPKNRYHTPVEAREVLSSLFHESGVDPDRPILAAVSRYDIHKNQAAILRAFQKLRKTKKIDPPPYLIFLGNTATDDPEGDAILDHLKALAANDPDIHFWVNVEDNDRVVGSLMRIARGFIHISTREGFGLVVSEALWQGTPVIGSRVGGITKQVIDGETGYTVDPLDVDDVASKMARLLEHPGEAEVLGQRGRERVREHFLMPALVKRYLDLLRYYGGTDEKRPDFRLNGPTYGESIQALRSKRFAR